MAESGYYNPGANPIFSFLYGNEEDELQLKLKAAREKKNPSAGEIALIKAEIDADTQHQQQQLMDIAATAGASSGGPAVSHGRAMPYGDTAMFNPKAMPNPLGEEEDEYAKQLRAPGFATFGQQYMKPYRMYS